MRRLVPLYAAIFFQGFILWYSIEKLFMTSIGFTPTSIGLMAAAYSVMMFVIETPSSILADRWSRKGILIIANLTLAASSIICGLSNSVPMFVFGAVIWGIFYALYSGTYDAVVYDTLLEETGHAEGYEKYYGRVRVMDSIGLVVGSLTGGVVAAGISLRATFFLSLPAVLLSIVALLIFREPLLHKAKVAEPLLAHIKATFGAVTNHRSLVPILSVLILGTMLHELVTEFDQLWFLAVSAPTILYGPAAAIILGSIGVGGVIAPRLKLDNRPFVIGFCAVFLTAGIILLTSHSIWLLILAITIICVSTVSLDIIYLKRLHDHLPSSVRAGASSTVNTTARGLFILAALAFGYITEHTSVFVASWFVLVPLIFIAGVLYSESNAKHYAHT